MPLALLFVALIGRVEAGAAVIAFDIDFAEPDRTPSILLLPLLGQNGVGNAEAERLLATLPDPDQQLAEAMGALPVVTGFILTDLGQTPPPLPKTGVAFVEEELLGHGDSFPMPVSNLPGWRPRQLETAFSTNLSIGAMSFAGFRWFCGSAESRIRPSPPRRSPERGQHIRADERDSMVATVEPLGV